MSVFKGVGHDGALTGFADDDEVCGCRPGQVVIRLETPGGRRSGIHPLRSYALSGGVTSVQTNSLNPKLTAAVTEPSLNAELGCIKVVDTFRGAYRTVRREQALERWMTGVPEPKKASLIPAGWFDAWADAAIASDPDGAKMTPPVLRAPNGVVQDGLEFFGAGKPYYDPAKITVPTLLVLAEWDRDTPTYMAQTLFPLLVNAPGKRMVTLAEGTHSIVMERNRVELFRAVQAFFDEANGS